MAAESLMLLLLCKRPEIFKTKNGILKSKFKIFIIINVSKICMIVMNFSFTRDV